MRTTIIAVLICIPSSFMVSCATTQRGPVAGYNTDYVYLGKIYPGKGSHVTYGSDFGQGYGLNYGDNDYGFGGGIDDYGLGYGIVDYGGKHGYYNQEWIRSSGWYGQGGGWYGGSGWQYKAVRTR